MTSQSKYQGMPIEERAKRFLAAYSKHGGKRTAKRFRQVGEAEQIQIAGQVTGEMISPGPDGHYYLSNCPGAQFHTGKNARKDCRFMPGGTGTAANGVSAPSLHCVHQSCGTVIEEMNRSIRSAIGKAGVEYITDHGSTLNNAAASLVIGFDLAPETAHKLLSEWGKACTPVHSTIACGKAVASAQDAYKKHPDEVGYLLKSARPASKATGGAPPSLSPSQGIDASYQYAADLGEVSETPPEQTAPPIYIGERGRIAREARAIVQAYQDDHGIDPTAILLGPDQPELSGKLCGLPIERMQAHGISCYG